MIRIIGLGSPFGDDRAGWLVVEALKPHIGPDIDAVALDRPGSALINWFSDVDRLILVDAVAGENTPGDIVEINDIAMLHQQDNVSSHQLDLAATLELARTLGQLPKHLSLYGIGVGEPDTSVIGEAVSAGARRLAEHLIREIQTERPG